MTTLTTDLTDLPGIGAKVKTNLAKLGIWEIKDLLFHLPRAYQDRTRLVPINELKPGQFCLAEGEILKAVQTYGRRRSLIVEIDDGTGVLSIRFFHYNRSQHQQMQTGRTMRVFGEVKSFNWQQGMIHPEYKIHSGDDELELDDRLTPVYPITDGVSQNRMRSWVERAFDLINPDDIAELIPQSLRNQYDLPELMDALHFMHMPPKNVSVEKIQSGQHPMMRRLIFEELLAHSVSLQKVKLKMQSHKAPVLKSDDQLENNFLKQLPFKPTGAQDRVCAEIMEDLSKDFPMLRLLQGDVGSGKTLVAARAAIAAISSGFQVAMMAPTEILAEQHYLNFNNWFEPLGVKVVFLVSKLGAKARREALAAMGHGTAQIVVGTQALFQEQAAFGQLGLVIVDEQHRFGVDQRRALLEKGASSSIKPHQLIMTATPIPRTLAMTAYADLNVSVIDELPPGRTPVQTVVVGQNRRSEIVDRIRHYCGDGHQAYWVCTLIEESEAMDSEAATITAGRLTNDLSDLQIGLVHGRLKADEKAAVMNEFKAGNIDVLVATTVIEVGVDVPNASMMVIENAERLGLSQLHQLRGRVGRGSVASYCVLLYSPPLSQTATERLNVMRETTDGFMVAQKDLELRGPGEFLGTRQTGEMSFRFAEVARDRELIPKVHKAASQMLVSHPDLAQQLVDRWLRVAEGYSEV